MLDVNPTGKHGPKKRRHGEGTLVKRGPYRLKDGTLRPRLKPWVAVIPYTDESGRSRRMYSSGASTKAEADELRKAALRDLARGRVGTDDTLGEYVSAWLSTIDVGAGTWPTYRGHLTERILPSLGQVRLSLVRPAAVRQAMTTWTGSPATRGGTLRLLRAAMKQAVADRLIEFDPTAGIPYPRIPRREPVTLTGEQARHLIATVEGERFAPILVASLGLAIRRGEALGLRTQDIDFVTGNVTIAHSLRFIAPALRAEGEDAYRLTGTKTGESRTLPLPAFVAEALRERIAANAEEARATKTYAYNDLVFCDARGNSIALETLRTWYLGALKRAGLPPIRWHDLRASSLTLLHEMGVDLFTIQAIAGHRDLDTTRRYVGRTKAPLDEAARRIEEAIGG